MQLKVDHVDLEVDDATYSYLSPLPLFRTHAIAAVNPEGAVESARMWAIVCGGRDGVPCLVIREGKTFSCNGIHCKASAHHEACCLHATHCASVFQADEAVAAQGGASDLRSLSRARSSLNGAEICLDDILEHPALIQRARIGLPVIFGVFQVDVIT